MTTSKSGIPFKTATRVKHLNSTRMSRSKEVIGWNYFTLLCLTMMMREEAQWVNKKLYKEKKNRHTVSLVFFRQEKEWKKNGTLRNKGNHCTTEISVQLATTVCRRSVCREFPKCGWKCRPVVAAWSREEWRQRCSFVSSQCLSINCLLFNAADNTKSAKAFTLNFFLFWVNSRE